MTTTRDAYTELLVANGLDRDRARVGAILATRYGRDGMRMLTAMLQAFIADLLTWTRERISSFLSCHDAVMS